MELSVTTWSLVSVMLYFFELTNNATVNLIVFAGLKGRQNGRRRHGMKACELPKT